MQELSHPNIDASWLRHCVYGVPTTETAVTDVIVGIQYDRITKILNRMNETNTEEEGS